DIFGGIAYVTGQVVAVTPWWGWVAGPPIALVLLMFTVLQFFFAASIGSEKRVNSLGPGGPIVVWIIVYVVLEIFMFAFLLIPVGITVDDGSLTLVSNNFLSAILTDTNPRAAPIGFVPAVLVASVALVWRTLISWNTKVSLT